MAPTSPKEDSEMQTIFGQLTEYVLRRVDIVLGTPAGIQRQFGALDPFLMIIDEADKLNVVKTMLTLASLPLTDTIIVGEPQQLTSRILKMKDDQILVIYLRISPAMCWGHLCEGTLREHTCELAMQHRSPTAVMKNISKLSYKGAIDDDKPARRYPNIGIEPADQGNHQILFPEWRDNMPCAYLLTKLEHGVSV